MVKDTKANTSGRTSNDGDNKGRSTKKRKEK